MGDFLAHHALMHGFFDEADIFNVELTAKQIQLIMARGLVSALNGKSTAVELGDKLSTNWAMIKISY